MSDLSELMQERAGMAAVAAYEEMGRPFYLLKPRVFPDGNAWIALYGSNIQEGICGCGDTPAQAAQDFDNSFFNQRLTIREAPHV
jgi:hypothetical protein